MDTIGLRIRNHVHGGVNNKLCVVTKIEYSIKNEKLTVIATSEDGIEFEHLNPIPLTEDLLINSGFKKMTRDIFELKNRECFELSYNIGQYKCPLIFITKNGCFNHVVPAFNTDKCAFYPIESLHQLQNLYFELTGKELELKSQI